MSEPKPVWTPGRDMDAAVARALGWHTLTSDQMLAAVPQHLAYVIVCCDTDVYWQDPDGNIMCGNDAAHGYIPPHYSTSDADALAALDAWLAKHPGMGVLLSYHPGARQGAGAWGVVLIGDNAPDIAWGDTRAEAICRAILAAKGENV